VNRNTDFNHYIINGIGYCFMGLGHLHEAVLFYERAIKGYLSDENWGYAGSIYINLADLYTWLGALKQSYAATKRALELSQKVPDKDNKQDSIMHRAKTEFLRGKVEKVNELLSQGIDLGLEILPYHTHLTRQDGILHSEYLLRIGNLELAYKVARFNLEICSESKWIFLISQCHRVYGDLDTHSGDHDSAHVHYESALKIARSISKRNVLIEALLARGRFFAKHMKDANAAFSDLNETLGYCVESGYRIYEADVRVALAWAYIANGEKEKARQSAERALQMSNEMGYHWGKVDAQEVLERVESSE
jgi:tetratricopeptide (TPR) repeat protein